MKRALGTSIAIALLSAAVPASAADDGIIARLATCEDSWFDWQTTAPAKLKQFGEDFRAGFSPHDNDPYFIPKASFSVAGLRVAQAYPESVGMGVGFSVVVDAPFDKARQSLEQALGKKLGKCEASDGMRSCELEIAEKRTVMLMAPDDPKNTTTLIGCYYFYEK